MRIARAAPVRAPSVDGRWISAATVLLAAACGGTRATAPPDAGLAVLTPAVEEAIGHAERTLRTRGLRRQPGERTGFLLERRADVAPAAMRAGRCYTFVAAASSGVTDLDVLVFDAEGAQVARDGSVGARAAARLCPPQTGTYHVAVRAIRGNGVFVLRTYEGVSGTGGSVDDLWPAGPASELP